MEILFCEDVSYGDSTLQRYAKKYRESLKQGSISGQVLGADELKNKNARFETKCTCKIPQF